MKDQIIISDNGDYDSINQLLEENNYYSLLVVCGKSAFKNRAGEYFRNRTEQGTSTITYFIEFEPNPEFSQVEKGVKLFKSKIYDLIVAIGGGSSIDVAKAIKYYSVLDNQEIIQVPILAIPTTAGSGAEATMYAVIYFDGEKKSVGSEKTLPDYVFFDSDTLTGLPLYHKKACMLDALCHSIESIWSLKATEESALYAKEAISIIDDNYMDYLNERDAVYSDMLRASYLAGKAIGITQTTAAHAMAYKLTKKYGLAHGHAVALCMNFIFQYLIEQATSTDNEKYIQKAFENINKAFGVDSISESIREYKKIVSCSELEEPDISSNDIEELVSSVNIERLSNMPIRLSQSDIKQLYGNMIKG